MLGTCLEIDCSSHARSARGKSVLTDRHLHDIMHMEPKQLRPSPVSIATKARLAKDARFGTIAATCR